MVDQKERARELASLLIKEQETQLSRWDDKGSSNKELRKSGELIFPLETKKHSFSFDQHPIIEIKYSNYYNEKVFAVGSSVQLFNDEDESCKGVIITIEDTTFQIQLFTDDLPEWIVSDQYGMKPQLDEKSFKYMKGILTSIIESKTSLLHEHLDTIYKRNRESINAEIKTELINNNLNQSQIEAVNISLSDQQIVSIQGPPGTGKTTTLVEIIAQSVKKGKKIIASAPSNTAVDNLALRIIDKNIKVIRLGNTSKVNEAIWKHTPEGILVQSGYQKELKKLRIEVNELRKKAEQFKRNFTKEDRDNRKKWREEALRINKEIRSLTGYYMTKEIESADVIIGTPVGLCDKYIQKTHFDLGLIDEAGQCLIPMGFLVMDNAKRMVLCGDQQQLPPTVIDEQAKVEGLGDSILEEILQGNNPDVMLNVQYRMPSQIADFSSMSFYNNQLSSHKKGSKGHLYFYDTSGAGFSEVKDENNNISNDEELNVILKSIEQNKLKNATFISPYSAQVRKAKKLFPTEIHCSTIDGFQGQEDETIIVSLVRNNENGDIGFLKDYRRMNVALTRAIDKLIVIGDSTTLGNDPFYNSFFEYVEANDAYYSVFEILYT